MKHLILFLFCASLWGQTSGITTSGNLGGNIDLNGVVKFGGTNTTGAGTALLGTNSPAVTVAAPYTWIEAVSSDGSTVYIPAWK